jgi:hypothetical protein
MIIEKALSTDIVLNRLLRTMKIAYAIDEAKSMKSPRYPDPEVNFGDTINSRPNRLRLVAPFCTQVTATLSMSKATIGTSIGARLESNVASEAFVILWPRYWRRNPNAYTPPKTHVEPQRSPFTTRRNLPSVSAGQSEY